VASKESPPACHQTIRNFGFTQGLASSAWSCCCRTGLCSHPVSSASCSLFWRVVAGKVLWRYDELDNTELEFCGQVGHTKEQHSMVGICMRQLSHQAGAKFTHFAAGRGGDLSQACSLDAGRIVGPCILGLRGGEGGDTWQQRGKLLLAT